MLDHSCDVVVLLEGPGLLREQNGGKGPRSEETNGVNEGRGLIKKWNCVFKLLLRIQFQKCVPKWSERSNALILCYWENLTAALKDNGGNEGQNERPHTKFYELDKKERPSSKDDRVRETTQEIQKWLYLKLGKHRLNEEPVCVERAEKANSLSLSSPFLPSTLFLLPSSSRVSLQML